MSISCRSQAERAEREEKRFCHRITYRVYGESERDDHATPLRQWLQRCLKDGHIEERLNKVCAALEIVLARHIILMGGKDIEAIAEALGFDDGHSIVYEAVEVPKSTET